MQLRNTLKAVALLEGLKGVVVITAGFGLLSLLHQDIQLSAEHIVAHLHLNPAKGFPRIFIEYSTHLSNAKLAAFSVLAFTYATARLIEAYGLWYERVWAEWFAIISAGVYIPFELYELITKTSLISILAFTVNIGIVVVMIYSLRKREYTDQGAQPNNQLDPDT